MDSERKVEDWFEKRKLTLDVAGLSDEERSEGSIFLGGANAEFVTLNDQFDFSEVKEIVFKWGDSLAQDIFARMLEHDDNPEPPFLFPFSASTVIESELWHLAVQDKDFDPNNAYQNEDDYVVIPFDSGAEQHLETYIQLPTPRKQLIGKVGQRWVLFEMGISLFPERHSKSVEHEKEISEEVLLNDEQMYQIIKNRLDIWDFESHTDEENIVFAHNLVFDIANNFPYLTYATSQEFKGEEMPSAVKPIWMVPWSPMDLKTGQSEIIECYPHDMVIYLKKREEHKEPPYPDKLHEIMERAETFDAAMEEIRNNSELMADLITHYNQEPQVDEAIYVTLDESYGGSSGLRLLIEPNNIALTIHGKRDETAELCNFLAIYGRKINVLAKLAAELAILGAKYCIRSHNPRVAQFSLSQFDKQFLNDRGINSDRD